MSDSDHMLMDQEARTVRQPKARHWVWVGLALVTVGFVAVLSTSFKPRQSTLGMKMAHGHSVMSAFTERLLSVPPSNRPGSHTHSSHVHHLLISEVGAAAPSAMSINLKLSQAKFPDTAAYFTVKAKDNKFEQLVAFLDKEKKELTKLADVGSGTRHGAWTANSISILTLANNHAEIMVTSKKQHLFTDMKPDWVRARPVYWMNVSFGADLGAIVNDEYAHFPAALKGLDVKGDFQMSEVILREIAQQVSEKWRRQVELVRMITSQNLSLDMRYTSDADFSMLPTVNDAVKFFTKEVAQLPEKNREILQGLDALIDGVTSLRIQGLPDKNQLEVEFKNFHIAPLLKDVIDNLPNRVHSLWDTFAQHVGLD